MESFSRVATEPLLLKVESLKFKGVVGSSLEMISLINDVLVGRGHGDGLLPLKNMELVTRFVSVKYGVSVGSERWEEYEHKEGVDEYTAADSKWYLQILLLVNLKPNLPHIKYKIWIQNVTNLRTSGSDM